MNDKEVNWVKVQDYNPNVDYYTPYIGIYDLNIIVFNVSPIDMYGNAFINAKIVNISHSQIKIIVDESIKLETRDSEYVKNYVDMIANRVSEAAKQGFKFVLNEIKDM